MRCSAVVFSLLMFTNVSHANNMQSFDNINVHYIALNSTFLTPEIASAYKITRSKVNALLNISVLANNEAGMPAKSVTLVGKVKNILGQERTLEFVEVKEGDAIYYLAEFSFTSEEVYRFNLDIYDNGNKTTLKFQQKIYAD